MGWNYRVVKMEYPNSLVFTTEQVLKIKEIYYDKDGNINGYGDAPVPYGESIDEIRESLCLMLQALDEPILNYSDIKAKN